MWEAIIGTLVLIAGIVGIFLSAIAIFDYIDRKGE